MINCMIAGVGGQGTVLASKLIAAAAIDMGLPVRTTETIGMAQRGGSVVSHIRMGEGAYSPLIPKKSADLIIAFEPAEGVRLLPFMAPDGMMIACDRAVKPTTDALSGSSYQAKTMTDFLKAHVPNLVIIDGEKLVAETSARALNVALLGAAVESGKLGIEANAIEAVIESRIPERFRAMNMAAFQAGRRSYHEQ